MALTSTIAYCENQDVFDAYGRISDYNIKRRLSATWVQSGVNWFYYNSGSVTRLFKNGEDLGGAEEDPLRVDRPNEWIYNAQKDYVHINQATVLGGSDPNADIYEAGDIWEDVITRFRRKASRLIESELGSSISREILKDREGNYPTSINQAVALKTAILFLSAHNPLSPDIISLKAEYDDIIGKIKLGTEYDDIIKIIIAGHRSADDSKGILRLVTEVTGAVSYNVHPVELKGNYSGSYELLYLYFLGYTLVGHNSFKEMTYWVKGKSTNKLIDKTLVEETQINFDYQKLGVDDLQIRFSTGASGATLSGIGNISELLAGAEITTPIVYEIELWGKDIQPTVTNIKPIEISKRDILWH
tara:strand:+ start:404 stop:1480 length:1077 start_codon:yes stop_codon:yes gene_type:complete